MTVYLTTGTIAVTNGSAAVTGTDTDWATALVTSGVLYVDGGAYPIASVASDTALTLALPYAGATGSGLAYAIGRSEAIQDQTILNANRLAEILATIPTFTTFARTIFDDADAASVRMTIGAQGSLGYTPANKAGDTFAGNVGLGDGINRTPAGGTNHLTIAGDAYAGHITLGSTGMWIGNTSIFRDLIFDIGNIERARIDTGGRLLVGSTPSFTASTTTAASAKTTGSTRIGKSGEGTVSVLHNNGSHFDSATGLFTAPVAGKYCFVMAASAGEASSGPSLSFSRNGSFVGATLYMYQAQYKGSANTLVMQLAAGDYVAAEFRHLLGASSSLYSGTFAGFLIN